MSRTHAKEVVTLAEPGAARRGVAVLVPCYDEEPTAARVVARFRAEPPRARVYVFDDNPTDRTAVAPGVFLIAEAAGLFVCGLLSPTAGLIPHPVARRPQEFEYHMRVPADELRSGRARGRRAERRRRGGAPNDV
ncbi:MAG TPA: hypothetical protein VF591_16285 [Pyrinomonadaceae bacterium]|jgi:hypothetical protein